MTLTEKQNETMHLFLDGSLDINKEFVNYSKGNITFGDFEILYEFSKNKDIVVELGTNFGTSSMILSKKAKKVYTIDIFEDIELIEDEEQRKHYQNHFNVIPKSYQYIKEQMKLYAKNVNVIKGLSYKLSEKFDDNSIDMIFIDADHSYEGAKKDFTYWKNKIKKGGIYLLHDIKDIEEFKGLYNFYKELKNNKNVKEIIYEPSEITSIKIFERIK